jgi:hypothetical protein
MRVHRTLEDGERIDAHGQARTESVRSAVDLGGNTGRSIH